MARLRRDTAWRSLEEYFKRLPPQATVEVTKVGRPPRGTDMGVKVEIAVEPATSTPVEIKTAAGGGAPAKPRRRKPGPHADV